MSLLLGLFGPWTIAAAAQLTFAAVLGESAIQSTTTATRRVAVRVARIALAWVALLYLYAFLRGVL